MNPQFGFQCRCSQAWRAPFTSHLVWLGNWNVMLARSIQLGAPSGRFTRSYAPTCRANSSEPSLNALPMSAPIGTVHALLASAVQSYVIDGSHWMNQPLSKL